jgi:hypothetical protein
MARLLWQQRQDIGPSNRVGPSMVYMASRGRTLLWGGYAALGFQGDTWEWDAEGWVQVADTGPPPTAFVGLSFDSNRDVVVLFTNNAAYTAGDTWEWDGEAWTQIDDAGPGVPNGLCGMVYDSARNRTVLEGGALVGGSPTYPPIGTWVWDGAAWTQVADVGPPQVAYYALAYDSSRERVIHFGGLTTPGFVALSGDTWEWDGTLWEQVADFGPNPRYGPAMAGNLLLGGYADGNYFRDTWSWDGEHWRQRQDIGPSPRGFSGMAWDSSRNRAVLFGGQFYGPMTSTTQYFGDTWESVETEQ